MFFSITRIFFSHSRSEQFSKQNTKGKDFQDMQFHINHFGEHAEMTSNFTANRTRHFERNYQYAKHQYQISRVVKFRYSEKATKIEKDLPSYFTFLSIIYKD